MFNNSINISKMNNHLSLNSLNIKRPDMLGWRSRSWLDTDTKHVAGLNRLMGPQSSPLDHWISTGNT